MFLALRLLGVGIPLIAGWFVYGWGSQVIERYGRLQATNALLIRKDNLCQARSAAHAVQLKRRTDAIAASKCKAQIENWIKNPDDIPQPFNPFNKLGGNSP